MATPSSYILLMIIWYPLRIISSNILPPPAVSSCSGTISLLLLLVSVSRPSSSACLFFRHLPPPLRLNMKLCLEAREEGVVCGQELVGLLPALEERHVEHLHVVRRALGFAVVGGVAHVVGGVVGGRRWGMEDLGERLLGVEEGRVVGKLVEELVIDVVLHEDE
ncbi:hypothetical protein OsI_06878 [Oryza sativa Indica Group]|uniref:Uncharacterized protein n=1 Tax=Oryza sativa subsp. indica TaxID=39946 RepID=A2X3T8_ORYSI|nr:hypothetical protein OsI_06878 [Oryza sativa Indica Group]